MNLIPTWPIAVGALVLGMAGGAYVDHAIMAGRIDKINATHAEQERERQVVRAADELAARQKEQTWAERLGKTEQEKQDEIARVRAAGAAAIAGLQNRPDRKPAGAGGVPQAAPACQGATGAELSRSDAGFLVGEAARADELRAALGACYSAYDSLR